MTRSRWLILVGVLVSATLAWMVVERLDWPVFWAALDQVRIVPLMLAIPVLIGGVVARGIRWMLIVVGRPDHMADFLRSTCMGYLGNTILPLRAGEVLRIFAVNRLTAIAAAKVTAGAVADRLLDVVMLGVMLSIVLAVHGAAVVEIELDAVDVALVGAGFIAIAAAMAWGRRWQGPVGWLAPLFPKRAERIIYRLYEEIGPVFVTLREPRGLAVAGALTALATATDLLAVWLVMTAFGWSMPLLAAVTVVVFLNVGALVPAAPGYIGIFQVACIFALNLFGIGESEAVAFSVVFQLIVIFLLIALGAVALISSGDRLGPWPQAVAGKKKAAE
jgi:glycosyltransferase 2 family protein